MSGSSLIAPPRSVVRIAFKSPSGRAAFREFCSDLQLKSSSSPEEATHKAKGSKRGVQSAEKTAARSRRHVQVAARRRRALAAKLDGLRTQEAPLTEQEKVELEEAETKRKLRQEKDREKVAKRKRLQYKGTQTQLTDQEKLELEKAEAGLKRRNETDRLRNAARMPAERAAIRARYSAPPKQNKMAALAEPPTPQSELECLELEAVHSSDEISAIVMCRYSSNEDATERRRLEQSQRVLIDRLAGFWRLQGVNVTRIYSCIRLRRSRDRIKEEFLDGFGNDDERRLYNTLSHKLGSRVYIVQRGLDGITDKASLTSWLRY